MHKRSASLDSKIIKIDGDLSRSFIMIVPRCIRLSLISTAICNCHINTLTFISTFKITDKSINA
jgi:hypothetical protein